MSPAKRVKRRADGKELVTKVKVKRQTKGKQSSEEVADVCLHVIDEVIQNVREDFLVEGVDESALLRLRELWEYNLRQSGVCNGADTREGGGPAITRADTPSSQLCDLVVPCGATDEYQSFTSTGEPIVFNCNPPGPEVSTDGAAGCVNRDIQRGELLPCTSQPDPWTTQNQWAVDVNDDVLEASEGFHLNGEAGHGQASVAKGSLNLARGKRIRELTTGSVSPSNYFPQSEGVEDFPSRLDGSQKIEMCLLGRPGEVSFRSFNSDLRRLRKSDSDTQVASPVEAFPRDGCVRHYDDTFDNGVLYEDYNDLGDDESHMEDSGELGELKVEPAQWGSGVSNMESVMPEGRDLDQEQALNEDFVFDHDIAVEAPQAAFKADHLILAKVVNVKRTKNRWKCNLKHGIMNLNNKDYLFLEASGQFEF